jgi:hypothetical protein
MQCRIGVTAKLLATEAMPAFGNFPNQEAAAQPEDIATLYNPKNPN